MVCTDDAVGYSLSFYATDNSCLEEQIIVLLSLHLLKKVELSSLRGLSQIRMYMKIGKM